MLGLFTRSSETFTPRPVRARSMIPRPYQSQGISWLHATKRGLLADAPGLGKTLQSAEAAELPVLVTCPLELVEQWREFLEDQYPTDKVVVACYGSVLKRTEQLLKPFDWMIVNHDMFSRFIFPQVTTLIVDESHEFRVYESGHSQGLRRYAKFVERVYELTATPEYKDVSSLWHQLHILDPKAWNAYWHFLGRFAVTSNYSFGTKIIRVKSRQRLDHETAPYMMVRNYGQVGMVLPQRIDEQVVLQMTDAQYKRYKLLRDEYVLELPTGDKQRMFNASAVLHKLRALTITDEKLTAVKHIIDRTPGKEPIIVFCMYVETAHKLGEALKAPVITGEVEARDRRGVALTGTQHEIHGARVRVATMGSLSQGVDLSDFRTIIVVEETYLPGQQHQALSRVVRARTGNQDTNPVLCYWVRYKNTVDANVHNAVRRRVSDANSIIREALL